MVSKEKIIYVYDDFSFDKASLMGYLSVDVLKGEESYSFEFDKIWLERTGLKFTPDPELMPYSGRQYPSGKAIFGLFSDSSP
ncbi:MAG: type II toxin-antitoxin system HipA family toxin, partial [Oribacterium parvum]|nr:type II toxin-antitoxin system HipA family toxin [Oribacterium parvum]